MAWIDLARRGEVTALREVTIDGVAALVVELDGGTPLVVTGEQQDGRITRIYLLLNADKLRGISARPAVT